MGPLDHKQSFPEAWQPLVKAHPCKYQQQLVVAANSCSSLVPLSTSTNRVGQKWNFISYSRFHLFNTPNILWVHMIYKSIFISTLLDHQTKLFFTLVVQTSGKNTDTHLSKVCVFQPSAKHDNNRAALDLMAWGEEQRNPNFPSDAAQ